MLSNVDVTIALDMPEFQVAPVRVIGVLQGLAALKISSATCLGLAMCLVERVPAGGVQPHNAEPTFGTTWKSHLKKQPVA
jgi:hypothetical protein